MSDARTALLVGGPMHGEHAVVDRYQREITFSTLTTLPTCFGMFRENDPLPVSVPYRNEVYRRMDDRRCGDSLIFEHESLWDANVKRAAEKLDREIEAAYKAQREIAERAQRALDKLTGLVKRRDKLSYDYGI